MSGVLLNKGTVQFRELMGMYSMYAIHSNDFVIAFSLAYAIMIMLAIINSSCCCGGLVSQGYYFLPSNRPAGPHRQAAVIQQLNLQENTPDARPDFHTVHFPSSSA